MNNAPKFEVWKDEVCDKCDAGFEYGDEKCRFCGFDYSLLNENGMKKCKNWELYKNAVCEYCVYQFEMGEEKCEDCEFDFSLLGEEEESSDESKSPK